MASMVAKATATSDSRRSVHPPTARAQLAGICERLELWTLEHGKGARICAALCARRLEATRDIAFRLAPCMLDKMAKSTTL